MLHYFSEYGGLGLDYSYSAAVAEELGNINCGAIAMAIGVQIDMATPALAKYVYVMWSEKTHMVQNCYFEILVS